MLHRKQICNIPGFIIAIDIHRQLSVLYIPDTDDIELYCVDDVLRHMDYDYYYTDSPGIYRASLVGEDTTTETAEGTEYDTDYYFNDFKKIWSLKEDGGTIPSGK